MTRFKGDEVDPDMVVGICECCDGPAIFNVRLVSLELAAHDYGLPTHRDEDAADTEYKIVKLCASCLCDIETEINMKIYDHLLNKEGD